MCRPALAWTSGGGPFPRPALHATAEPGSNPVVRTVPGVSPSTPMLSCLYHPCRQFSTAAIVHTFHHFLQPTNTEPADRQRLHVSARIVHHKRVGMPKIGDREPTPPAARNLSVMRDIPPPCSRQAAQHPQIFHTRSSLPVPNPSTCDCPLRRPALRTADNPVTDRITEPEHPTR